VRRWKRWASKRNRYGRSKQRPYIPSKNSLSLNKVFFDVQQKIKRIWIPSFPTPEVLRTFRGPRLMRMTAQKFFFLNGIFFLLLLSACAPKLKPLEVPEYRGTLASFLTENSEWKGLSGSFALKLKKPDGLVVSADAFIETGPEKFEMRFYRLGFSAGELGESTDPKYLHLREGLRDALIWWQVGEYRASSSNGNYILEMNSRTLTLDRKTLVPLTQALEFPEGQVAIEYSAYQPVESLWYPFKMEIRYSGYRLELVAKKIELTN
jgi:hypothetical protein